MTRALVFLCLALTACGRRLDDAQAELAALQRDEQRLNATVGQLQQRVVALQKELDAEQARASKANSDLRATQLNAVELWKGNAELLAEKKKALKAPLPASLASALDTAQSGAGGQTVAKRFAAATAAGKGAEAAQLLDYWESYWLDAVDPAPEEPEAKVCPTKRTLPCKRIDDDSLWCPDPENNASWAMLLSSGDLDVARLNAGERHVVEARLAPRVWLTRVGEGEDQVLFLHELRGKGSLSFVTQWQTRALKADAKLESLRVNLDEDPYTEALFWAKDELVYADPYNDSNVALVRGKFACDALAQLEKTVPRPVTELCARLAQPTDAGVADAGN